MADHGEGTGINFYIWCAVGAGVGWLVGHAMGSSGKVVRIEEVLVGVFGAFIGGEFVPGVLRGDGPDPGFTGTALACAVAGAVVMLLVLRTMRKAVGPLRTSRSPASRRR